MSGSDTIAAGQTWQCDESRADDPRHDYGDVTLHERYPRFHAVVDCVDGDYVALTVTRRNRHMATPDPGDHVVKSARKMQADPRWRPR